MKQVLGIRSIEEHLRKEKISGCLYVSGQSKRSRMIAETARRKNVRIVRLDHEQLSARAGTVEHKGLLLEIDSAPAGGKINRDLHSFLQQTAEKNNAVICVLDEITDPRNLGAVLRSAELFQVDFVIVPERNSAHTSPVVTKTSAGADAYVPVTAVPNISRALDELKKYGFWVYAADMTGEAVWNIDLTGKTALVLGNEGKGVRKNVRSHCDTAVSIPTGGKLDSLNVSVAAGIFFYEAFRQQRTGQNNT